MDNKRTNEILLYNSLKGLHFLEKDDKLTVLDDLLGIQSQFAGYAKTSLLIRANDFSEETWSDGIVKIWSHRGTMHLVSERQLPLHLAAAGYPREFYDGVWEIPRATADKWAPFIVQEIRNGNTSRNGLKEACKNAGKPGNQKEYLIPDLDGELPNRDEARMEI